MAIRPDDPRDPKQPTDPEELTTRDPRRAGSPKLPRRPRVPRRPRRPGTPVTSGPDVVFDPDIVVTTTPIVDELAPHPSTPQFVDVMGTTSRTQVCVPRQGMNLVFTPRSGPLTVVVTATRFGHPSGNDDGIVGKPGGDPDDDIALGIRTLATKVSINIEGRPPTTVELGGGLVSLSDGDGFEPIEIDLPAASDRKRCRVTVTNRSGQTASVKVVARYVRGRHRLFSTRVPISLLNGAARELVKGLGLELRLDGDDSFIDFSDDLKRHGGSALRRQRFNAFGTNDINLRTVSAVVSTVGGGADRRTVLEVHARFEEAGRELSFSLADADLVNLAIKTRFELDRHLGCRATVEHGVLIDGNIFADATELVVEGITAFLGLIGLGPGHKDFQEIIGDLGEAIEDKLNDRKTREVVRGFLQEGLVTLAHRGDTFLEMLTSPDALVVKHRHPTVEEPPPRPSPLPQVSLVAGSERDILEADRLAERIDHIVVLMLENRSFDHLFGHLSLPGSGRTDVDGLRGDEANSGVGVTIPVEELTDTTFPISPDHGHEGVLQQMADGRMTGFVANFLRRFGDHVDITEFHPMGYYGAGTLPAHDFLTRNYLVCDRWFCAHPGPTWPNRFATFCGQIPSLDNFSLDDPRIGFTQLATVFDRLPRSAWRVYESDIAFLRMFDRHRLDDRNIRPADRFAADVDAGDLPLFTFLEPDYTDVVPVDRIANDDHPPADLLQGQRLLEQTYNALRQSPLWSRSMLVITYDEHGGFHDHVAPPGTSPPNTDPEDVEPQARLHPDGPTFLGPRVPSLVISPWVAAGVSSTVFDHTSIAKTVLLRHFGASWPDMGDRVALANSLGSVVLDERRSTAGVMPPIDPPRPPNPFGPGKPPDPDHDDFHEAMRRFPAP